MADKVYTLKEIVEEQVKPVNQEKEWTLALLGADTFPSLSKKVGKSEEFLKEMFARTLRRALMFSNYPDEGSYTIKQWKQIVETLK